MTDSSAASVTLGEIYGFVVYGCGISPSYFLDEMQPKEVEYLAEARDQDKRERWEMLRLINHAVIGSQSTKKLKPEDIMKFPWDGKIKSREQDVKKEIERIKKKYNING